MSNPKERLSLLNAMERDNSSNFSDISESEAEEILDIKAGKNVAKNLKPKENNMHVNSSNPNHKSNEHYEPDHRPSKNHEPNYQPRKHPESNYRPRNQCYSNCGPKEHRESDHHIYQRDKFQYNYDRNQTSRRKSEIRKKLSDLLWSSTTNIEDFMLGGKPSSGNDKPSSGNDKPSNTNIGNNYIGGLPVTINGIPIGPAIPIVHRNGVVFLTPPGPRNIIY